MRPNELGVSIESFAIIRRRDHLLSPGGQRVLDQLRTTARRLYVEPPLQGLRPGKAKDLGYLGED